MNFYNILVIGSDSQIAKEIQNLSNRKKKLNYFFFNKKKLDIRKTKKIEEIILKKKYSSDN